MPSEQPKSFALTDGILFTGETFVEGHSLIVEDGHVLDIIASSKTPANLPTVSCPEHIIAPGFIDCQVNGGAGIYFNDQKDIDSILKAIAPHRQCGTTRILPTITTAPIDVTYGAINLIRKAKAVDPSIIGIHLEGPHISKERKGVHHEPSIRALTKADMEKYAPEAGERILLTVAPETVPPEQITKLVEDGFIVSIGHSAAAPELLRKALASGANCFTHLYNAMGPLSAREPGPAGIALDDRNCWCSIIMDGLHVSHEMIRLALRAKPLDKLFLISDACELAGNSGYLMKSPITNEAIRGSFMTLGEIVSYAVREIKLDPTLVLRMASTLPATFLGLDDTLGKLLPGYKADIVALDHFFRAEKVWREGERFL